MTSHVTLIFLNIPEASQLFLQNYIVVIQRLSVCPETRWKHNGDQSEEVYEEIQAERDGWRVEAKVRVASWLI